MRLSSCAAQTAQVVTRWGLFLKRGVHLFFSKSNSLWKAETVAEDQDANSTSFVTGRYCSGPRYTVSEALSKELDTREVTDMMNTK